MTTSGPPALNRQTRWWKWVFVALGLVFVIAILSLWAAGEFIARAGRALIAGALAETEQADARWRWLDLESDRSVVRDEDNSIRQVLQAHAAMAPWEGSELSASDGKDLLDVRPPNHRLDPERLKKLLHAMRKQSQATKLALSLKDMPGGRSDLDLTPDVLSTSLAHAQSCREVVGYLLRMDAERLLHQGGTEEAAARVHVMFHAGAGLRDEPFLVSQLVRMVIRRVAARQVERTLALGEVSDETCRRLMGHLAAERGENLLLVGLRGERAALHIAFENLESGSTTLPDVLRAFDCPEFKYKVPPALALAGELLYRPRLPEDHANGLRLLNRACSLAARADHARLAEWEAYEADLNEFVDESRLSLRNVISTLVLQDIQKYFVPAVRHGTLLDCARAGLAAERFRLANHRWPTTLAELRSHHLKELPTDPLNGEPLRLAATADGITVYSVDSDGKDHGVRLYNPERRGLEPLKMPTAE